MVDLSISEYQERDGKESDQDDSYIVEDIILDEGDSVDIKDKDIIVAAPKAKNVIFIALAGCFVIFILYNIVFSDKRTDKEKLQAQLEQEAQKQPIDEDSLSSPPEEDEDDNYIAVVDVPEIPEIPDNIINDTNRRSNIPFIDQEALNSDDLLSDLFTQSDKDNLIEEDKENIEIFEPLREVALTPDFDINKDKPKTVKTKQLSTEDQRALREKMEKEKERLRKLYSQGFGSSGNLDSVPDREADAPVYQRTPSTQVAVTSIGNPDDIIGEGKTIEAVLETAINTEIEGPVRAIISRDIYAETGRRVLIPRGSRLSGEYKTATLGNTGCRLAIMWNRIMLPNGTDITLGNNIDAFASTDQLGRAGICGFVDDKYFETLAGAALLSTVTIAGASIADAISPQQQQGGAQSSTTQPDGAITVTNNQQNPVDQTIIDSLSAFGTTAGRVLTQMLDGGRVIIIPQGARMRVFVQNDIVFPATKKLLMQ